jgi:hypothetical protein
MGWFLWFLAILCLLLLWGLYGGPRGLRAKLHYLFGLKLPDEDKRFNFVPFGSSKTDLLVVSFAGGTGLYVYLLNLGALKIGGHSQPEFQRSLAFCNADQVSRCYAVVSSFKLYVLDPTGMSWFLRDPHSTFHGIEFMETELKERNVYLL